MASGLTQEDFRRWVPVLQEKLERFQPLVVCFHGFTGYRQYCKRVPSEPNDIRLGLQDRTIGRSRVIVAPNPSPANARFSLADLAMWYRVLKAIRDDLMGPQIAAHVPLSTAPEEAFP